MDQDEYVDWLVSFGPQLRRVLKDTGSLVLDLGGAYRRGIPCRSLYNYRVLLRLCDEHGFHLAEEFFWHNPAKLPSPIEWVNKRKIRAKDSVNTVWWLSKSENPKANVSNVLAPYSDRMKQLMKDPEAFYRPKERPSGHDISGKFGKRQRWGDSLESAPVPEYRKQLCPYSTLQGSQRRTAPGTISAALPEFFIKFLTDPGDTVMDIFAGSNTTGEAAELLGRQMDRPGVRP